MSLSSLFLFAFNNINRIAKGRRARQVEGLLAGIGALLFPIRA